MSGHRALVGYALLVCFGCGPDVSHGAASVMSSAANAGASGAAGQPAAAESDVRAIIRSVIDAYDRGVEGNCPCQVEMKAYASVEECSMWQHSGPDWVDCATAVLAEHDSPANRMSMQCFAQLMADAVECEAALPCGSDARGGCRSSPLSCLGNSEALPLALGLAMQCPDIGLLTRQ